MSDDTKTVIAFCRNSSGKLTGASQMILRLATGLDNNRFHPRIITQINCVLSSTAKKQSISVEIIPYRGILDTYEHGLMTKSPIKNAATLARILQYNYEAKDVLSDVDIIWCDGIRTVLTLGPTALLTNTTILWNVGLGVESNGIYKWLNELGFRLTDHIFIESKVQAKRQFGDQFHRHREKFTIFHKGIDTERFAPSKSANGDNDIEGKTIRIGTAATLTERKGHINAVDAIAEVVEQHPEQDITYAIAGGTSRKGHEEYKTTLEQRIAEHELENVVEFKGWVDADDMPAFYDSLDIFVLASEDEGIPGVVREALSMECAVVATDVGGTPEAVITGETGYLVPPKNSEAIAEAIATLIESPELQREMGQNGREHIIENFSIQSYVENYERFLTHIVTT